MSDPFIDAAIFILLVICVGFAGIDRQDCADGQEDKAECCKKPGVYHVLQ